MKNMKKLLQRAMVFTLSAAMLVGTPMTASAAGLVDLYSIGDGTGDYIKDANPTGTITNTDTNTGFLIGQNEARIVGITLDRETVKAEKFEPETLKATVVMDGTITAAYDYEDPHGEANFKAGDDITQYVVDELSKKIKWEVVYTDAEGNVIPDSKNLPLPTDKVGLSGSAADRSVVTLNPKQGTKEGQEVTVRASIDASYYFAQATGGVSQNSIDLKHPVSDLASFKQDDARKGIFYTADAKVSVKEYSTGLKWRDNGTEDTMQLKHTLDLGAQLEREPETANDAITWTSSKPKAVAVSATGVVTAKQVTAENESVTITAVSERGKVATRTIKVEKGVKADVVKIFVANEDKTGKTTEKDLANAGSSTMKVEAVMYAKVKAYVADGQTTVPTEEQKNSSDAISEPAGTLTKNVEVKNGDWYIDADGKAQQVKITDEITWTSDKKAIATVDADGKVKLIGVGSAAITAKATNGKSAKTTVKVVATLGSLAIGNAPATAYSGQTYNLTAIRTPEQNKDAVTWAVYGADGTSKTKDASIDKKGVLKIANKVAGEKIVVKLETSKAVKPNAAGGKEKVNATPVEITIAQSTIDTITVKDGGTIVANGGFDKANKKLTKQTGLVSGTSEINVPLNRTFVASAIKYVDGTESNADASLLTWKTDNAKIAAISASGAKATIKAVGAGKATITVSGVRVNPKDNKASVLSVKFTVQVKQPVTSLTMNKPTVTLAQKDTKNKKGEVTGQANQTVSLKVAFGPKKAEKNQAKIDSWTVQKPDGTQETLLQTSGKNKGKPVTSTSASYTLISPMAGQVYKITATSVTGVKATSTITIVEPTTEVAIANKVGTLADDDGKVTNLERFSTKDKKDKDVLNTAELVIGSGKALQMQPVVNLGTAEKKSNANKPTNWVLAGTNDAEQVTYTVNKKGIVTLDSLGRVYPVKKGTVTITAKTPTGKKATLKVTVQ